MDPALLEIALTHRSFAYEHGVPDNERLEFLGDSVLGRAVTAMLYERFPDEPEGRLAKRRSALVSTVALAAIARTLGLGEHLRLGRGEERTGGRAKASLLADTMEALIGAAFLSVGSEAAEAFVLRLVAPLLDEPGRFGAATDPKTALQEVAAQRGAPAPVYAVTASGPEHARVFEAVVTVGALTTATGTGTSKKQAEGAAALAAFTGLAGHPDA
ncbi:ribonuclease III [Amnibacterium sp. CER49]|uniref:ribonuclease III n=1 Tax=Amnibacterium sp. CER49 TaxID=3039161 RepID=UPI002447950A|nr:ribonuclease III [Amnibacterium sp. CER49]MDH2442773.1 ribonuclease III [Amnibacterium sp. CER49]